LKVWEKRMQVDMAFEVTEVAFDQFERRKTPRNNISLVAIQNRDYLTDLFSDSVIASNAQNQGIEVNEVPFTQFERRKHPR